MLKEFKAFAMRGNVLDMAVGIIIGAGFGKIVTSFVEDVMMPPLGRLLGPADFSSLFLNLPGKHYDTLLAHQFPHPGVRRVSTGTPGQPLDHETCSPCGTDNERLPPVRNDHPDSGETLRPLHYPARLENSFQSLAIGIRLKR